MAYTAGNWSVKDDDYSEMFILQNLKQFWLPEEVALASDILTWEELSKEEQKVYMRVLGGLTLLDTLQGNDGMSQIAQHVESHQQKAVLTFMGGMENAVHARSYSNIFLTLASQAEIDGVFEWLERNGRLQKKAEMIDEFYNNISDKKSLYKAMVASVALESFLFYSGFFYPLYLAGQGKLRASGNIIQLIIRDESIHGTYVGLLARKLADDLGEDMSDFVFGLFDELLENEIAYTREIYDNIGLTLEVVDFVKYNANKALNNLGFENRYEHDKVSSIVLNGLNVGQDSHDFFSEKSSTYKKATVEAISDDDFIFE
ncbi:class 1b ribonucleoside-diphosphate reductase subunit beta [Staphylococcus felis]|uniref:class 1b ribonucleoside-diphosphate reductase subunit beta n=1 Tax=Staphylococcus felis TaxID=46127 RepID=UPI000CCFEDE9|nr:class 1b ribonucleoside-diphosphate reductase subunit beta [Staphylococcus felis]AVP37449.1 class 1b ribonucleoside-diphosphate reductase subunit beta [Staphylococcus felis]PNZ36243.1 class 1b ribonucleoside-diphosphate reductase subunit beta [Staphylococcus felis]QQB02601.1 class 1b ribonucleoside-diphosphate reductase subunit beta [Staphylococcus felis]